MYIAAPQFTMLPTPASRGSAWAYCNLVTSHFSARKSRCSSVSSRSMSGSQRTVFMSIGTRTSAMS